MARYGPVAGTCAPRAAETQWRTEAGSYFASRGMVIFDQGKIIAVEVASVPASGQRAHERRSALRHRKINRWQRWFAFSSSHPPNETVKIPNLTARPTRTGMTTDYVAPPATNRRRMEAVRPQGIGPRPLKAIALSASRLICGLGEPRCGQHSTH
jgi:hypothetical protein